MFEEIFKFVFSGFFNFSFSVCLIVFIFSLPFLLMDIEAIRRGERTVKYFENEKEFPINKEKIIKIYSFLVSIMIFFYFMGNGLNTPAESMRIVAQEERKAKLEQNRKIAEAERERQEKLAAEQEKIRQEEQKKIEAERERQAKNNETEVKNVINNFMTAFVNKNQPAMQQYSFCKSQRYSEREVFDLLKNEIGVFDAAVQLYKETTGINISYEWNIQNLNKIDDETYSANILFIVSPDSMLFPNVKIQKINGTWKIDSESFATSAGVSLSTMFVNFY